VGKLAFAGRRVGPQLGHHHHVPNGLCAALHNRMPVVLKQETLSVWLGEVPAGVPQLKTLLASCPSDEMTCWPVGPRVGNVKNNDRSLIEPIAAVG
jgi:putative SOS response-associated peptidase YedK